MQSLTTRSGSLIVAVVLAIGLVGCGSDDSDGAGVGGEFDPGSRAEAIAEYADTLMRDATFPGSQTEAMCVAEAVIDSVGFERLRAVLDAGEDADVAEDQQITSEMMEARARSEGPCLGLAP